MSLRSRIQNIFRADVLNREIDDELQSHLDEAVEAGRDPAEARRAFGSPLLLREQSRDIRLLAWLDSLRADSVFAWRQLLKKKMTSAAAVLSLALAIGACTSAFRLIDALLLRPLPVAAPERLYALARQGMAPDGKLVTGDGWAYPSFRIMRAAVREQGELLAVSFAQRVDVTYASAEEVEKAYVQYVSGWMFHAFGLRPAAGRLFTENDDQKPGAHSVAVLAHDYWTRHFGQDPKIVGRTFRMGNTLYDIVGVGPERFTGTETGTVAEIFLPSMMHPGAPKDDWTWTRAFASLKPGVAPEPVRARLDATSGAFEEQRAKGFTGMSKENIARFLDQRVIVTPASAGTSGLQQSYRSSLLALGVLVGLVLLIACANVANLMTAQAAARAREMALRVSIGAGRWRLVQLVLVESAWLALLSGAAGWWFAWWSAPLVVSRINPPGNPVRLFLPADWRVLGFCLALTFAVTLLFGLAPALRASSIKPASALRGGEDPRSRHRVMGALVGAQVAFCFLVLFVAGLFTATFDRLSNRPLGFSADRVVTLETVTQRAQPAVAWDQMADHLRALPGVEAVALSNWPLLGNGISWNGFVSVGGAPPGPELAYFLSISPGWMDAMKIPFVQGADFRPGDTAPGAAIVNETFVGQFLKGENPLGKTFAKGDMGLRIVGVVRDAPYRSIHGPTLPVAYVPIHSIDSKGALRPLGQATFIVRTSGADPLALAATLRREVPRARSEFRVSTIRSQQELVHAQTVRERLLANLAQFFAAVALLLAAIGLYGVLDYSVLQRRREIGIRMAIGAQPGDIARRVTADVFRMVLAGALAGLALGLASIRYIESLLYEVKPGDPAMLAIPSIIILSASLMAALPAVIRAVRIDPIHALRAE